MKTRLYPHVTGLYGDSGENPGALAVHAVLDPSPNYPENGRIIVGSPATTPTIPGYIPNLGGFNGGPAAIERAAWTLLEAARDARAAMGQQPAAATALDLDDLERKARAVLTAEANAPRSLEGAQLVTQETANASWEHQSATRPPTILALIAENRRLDAVAKAATAFVDEQGKRVDTDRGYTIGLPEDFASLAFEQLVRAVEGDGR